MNDVLLIHGKPSEEEYRDLSGPSPSNRHWLPWLQHALLAHGRMTQTPEMPEPYEPQYEEWKKTFEQFSLHENTIIVGHSCGAGFILRWLSENTGQKLKKIILVAPSLGLDWEHRGFMDFNIKQSIEANVGEIIIFVAKNDRPGIQKAADIIATKLPKSSTRLFDTGGHFTYSGLGREEFPELLEEIET
jgi:predicted alpha/beta hydrolase family esterase